MRTLELCKKLPIWLLGASLSVASLTSLAANNFPYEVDGDTEDSTSANPGDGSPGDYADGIRFAISGDDADTVFLQLCKAGGIRIPSNDTTSKYSNTANCGAAWAGGLFNSNFDPNGDAATAAFEQVFISDSKEPDLTHHKTDNKDQQAIGGAAGGGLGVGGDSNTWECVNAANVNNKLDLMEGVVAFYSDVSGNIHAHAGATRNSNNGEANLGVWYLKDPSVDCDPDGTGKFTGVHLDGDLLVVSEFSQGGAVATVKVFEWQDPSPDLPESGDELLVEIDTGANCSNAHADDRACGENNEMATIFPAWEPVMDGASANPKGSKPAIGELRNNLWTENVAQIIDGGSGECFAKVLLEARSSTSLSASLHDYMLADVDICGSITIEKVTIGDTGTFDIDTDIPDGSNAGGTEPSSGDFDLTTTASGVSGLDSETFINLQAGSYDVSELVPAGWQLTAMTCTGDEDNGSTIPVSFPISAGNTGTFLIDLDIGEGITCRFVNTALGDISATKVLVNACDAVDGGVFSLQLDGVTKATGGNATSFGPLDVSPDDYTVGEIAGNGSTNLANYTSTIGGACATDGSVTVGTGESKSCTITNVRRPTVRIKKEVTGGSLATFDLLIDDGNNNSFDHETLAQGDLGMTDTIVITTLKTGSTTTFGPVLVAETTADGAETLPGSVTIPASIPNFQTFWSCDDTGGTNGTGTSIEVPTLLSGEDVTCTVTNVPVAQAACTP